MNKKYHNENSFFILLFFLLHLIQLYLMKIRILIKVNNEIITTIDLLNEIQYLTLFNQNYKNLMKTK